MMRITLVFNFRRKIWETRKSPATHDNRRTEGGELLIYVLVEIFSFGTLSKFYKNMKNIDKKEVAKEFGVGYTYFESWLESISYVRKICAHYGRLYNAKLSKPPRLYNQYREAAIGNNRI